MLQLLQSGTWLVCYHMLRVFLCTDKFSDVAQGALKDALGCPALLAAACVMQQQQCT
jgi:hypothetical protein